MNRSSAVSPPVSHRKAAATDSKNYVSVQDDEITELLHTIKSACARHLENLCLLRQLEIFDELQQKPSCEPYEKM